MPIENLHQALRLAGVSPSSEELAAMEEANALYPMRTNGYFLKLSQQRPLNDPILLQVLPNPGELIKAPHLSSDPLAEETHSPVPRLIHRYPDRAVLLVTNSCVVRCRHCNRKRFWREGDWKITNEELEEASKYLKRNPQVREVILSGGDPLTLPTDHLREILATLKSVPSVKVLRIGTRLPVVAPTMVTTDKVELLTEFQPLWVNMQFNHPCEVTEESRRACEQLRRGGVPLGNQTVLLKGVNDCANCLRELFCLLVEMGVRPYYLFQCDLVEGVEHLRTPVARGLEIMASLIGHLSGIAVPTFAIDSPGGKGKLPLLPDYKLSMNSQGLRYLSYRGEPCFYPNPKWNERG